MPADATSPATVKVKLDCPTKFIMSLCQDQQGNIWAGTEDDGVWRMNPRTGESKQFTTKDGLGDDNGYAVACDRKGRIWVGHLNHGVSVYNGEKWQNYEVVGGLSRPDTLSGPLGERVFAIKVCAVDGDVWISTNCGLSRYSETHDNWAYYTRANGIVSDQVNSMAFDTAGDIFAGTACDGIVMARAKDGYGAWRNVRGSDEESSSTDGQGLPSNLINDVLVTRDDIAYAATDAGLARSADHGATWRFLRMGAMGVRPGRPRGRFRRSARAAAPAMPSTLAENYCTCLAGATDGSIWVGHRAAPVDVISSDGVQSGGDPLFTTCLLPGAALAGTYGAGVVSLADSATAMPASPAPVAPAAAPAMPSGASPPDLAWLNREIGEIGKVPLSGPSDATSVISLDDDWRTEGDWLGRYGRYTAILCAIDSPSDYVWGAGPEPLIYFATVGPHHDATDSLRYWVHWLYTDNPNTLEMPPTYFDSRIKLGYTSGTADRREAEWDDHGEAYSAPHDGPDICCNMKIPAGQFVLSVYDFNKDGHTADNVRRDLPVAIRRHQGSLYFPADRKKSPALASNRVNWFWGGVYKKFLVQGPTELTIEVARNHSRNAILSGVMLDLPEERPVPYFESIDRWNSEQSDRAKRDKAARGGLRTTAKAWAAQLTSRDTAQSAAAGVLEKLDEIRTLNPRWWALNQKSLAVGLARWCCGNLSDSASSAGQRLNASCYYQAGYFSQWEECQAALGETPARKIEKSLKWDGVAYSNSGHGYDVVTDYLAKHPLPQNQESSRPTRSQKTEGIP